MKLPLDSFLMPRFSKLMCFVELLYRIRLMVSFISESFLSPDILDFLCSVMVSVCSFLEMTLYFLICSIDYLSSLNDTPLLLLFCWF